MADTEILLESGTNEIEIMQFTIFGELYGINVAKVREIMMEDRIKPIPHAHPDIEGIFKPRDILLTVVNLPKYLTGGEVFAEKEKERVNSRDLFIVTNFNKMHIAFRVHTVVGISRISWTDIQKPDKTLCHGKEGVSTGIAQCGENLVTILDFERIVAEIAPETSIQMDEIDNLGIREEKNHRIILAEDSLLLSKMIQEALNRAGYRNIASFNNGKEAWNYLKEICNDSDFAQKASLLITDIEMPEMDGHRLTKLVKEDSRMKHLPVVIFSSLINEEMRIKGKKLGADEQLSKPEIGHLVEVMDRLIERNERANG